MSININRGFQDDYRLRDPYRGEPDDDADSYEAVRLAMARAVRELQDAAKEILEPIHERAQELDGMNSIDIPDVQNGIHDLCWDAWNVRERM